VPARVAMVLELFRYLRPSSYHLRAVIFVMRSKPVSPVYRLPCASITR
jgi:hypothetical protein